MCLPALRCALIDEQNTVTFSYAYTAKHLFSAAKKAGSICVLGQIDPGLAEQDWLKEILPWQVSQPRENQPAKYWADWRDEIEMADHIIVNSSWSKKLLTERADIPAKKIHTLPLAYTPRNTAIVHRQYPEKFTAKRPLRLLFLGQVIPRKGVHILLEAMRKLKDSPVQLDLVGPVYMELGDIPHNVFLRGAAKAASTASFYKAADVFILPTFSDGFAITQLEAAAHKLPMIVSRHLGAVVCDQENGLILNEVSSDAVLNAVNYCLANPEKLLRWSVYSLDWEEFSLNTLGKRLVEIADDKYV